jgi:hypothetical protein
MAKIAMKKTKDLKPGDILPLGYVDDKVVEIKRAKGRLFEVSCMRYVGGVELAEVGFAALADHEHEVLEEQDDAEANG